MKNMVKFWGFIAIAAIIGLGFAACDDEGNNDGGGNSTVSVTGITLNKTTLALTVGGSDTLVANIAPSNATNTNVTWISSNTSVATVNNGTVTASAAGTATITVTTADGGKTATCAVTVTAVGASVAVTGVTLNKTTLALTVGGSDTLVADIAPSNATNTNVTWLSSNPSVATVNNGTVNAAAAGTATITVTTADGGKTATCTVTVTAVGASVPVTGVTLNKTTLALTVGGSDTLVEDIAPSNATNTNVTWLSSNPSVATVYNGTVTAAAVGTATITVTTADGGKTAACTVTVTAVGAPVAVTGVTLNKTTLIIYVGTHETLYQTVVPENATNKAVTWTTSNASVAMVVDGLVYAAALGTATILVSTADGGKIATCEVTVTTAVTGVTLDKTTLTIAVGEHETLHHTVAPENATNKAVTWSSSNTSVATVNDGLVTAVAAGTATITVTTADGNKTAACEVTVCPHDYVWKVTSTTYPAQTTPTCTLCNTSGMSRAIVIGDTGPAGGIIIYIADGLEGRTLGFDDSTAYYLEAAPTNQATGIVWWSREAANISLGTQTGIGMGRRNTSLIIRNHPEDTAYTTYNYAAKAAVAYTGGGKSDWFLPSKDELNEMYKARTHLGISSGRFWSSSQDDNTWAWLQNFGDGSQNSASKGNYDQNVRAVRAF